MPTNRSFGVPFMVTLALACQVACPQTGAGPSAGVSAISTPAFPIAGDLPAETAPDGSSRGLFLLSGEEAGDGSNPEAGPWFLRFDASDLGTEQAWFDLESLDSSWQPVAVPAAWDLAHPAGYDRQSVGWYYLSFTAPESSASQAVLLRFDGAFREARVWLNGQDLGATDLPYLPFAFDVTAALAAGATNRLVVRIDNRIGWTTLPCDTEFNAGKHGWFPYGGLLRPVWLDYGLRSRPAQVLIRTDLAGAFSADAHFTHTGTGLGHDAVVEARILPWGVRDPSQALVTWLETPLPAPGGGEGLRFTAELPGAELWSPDHPDRRFTFEVTIRGSAGGGEDAAVPTETTGYDFAFRRLEARDQRFWFNGEDWTLKGINRHEDHPDDGPVFRQAVMDADLALVTELGANFSRPGHYPNDLRVLRTFESAGIALAEEIPVYQLNHEQLANPELVDRAVRALQAMIIRDYNRPGVVMWSVANEIHAWSPNAATFVQTMVDTAKTLDPDRPLMVAAASVPLLSTQDVASTLVDVVGVNEYEGWYINSTTDVTTWLGLLRARFPERTIFISEYGAGALAGRHSPDPPAEESVTDHSYSEEYQAWFHDQHISQFRALDWVRGFMPWVFADFRMQWTPSTGQPHPADRMNLKGLVSTTRQKKAAFTTVQSHFTALP